MVDVPLLNVDADAFADVVGGDNTTVASASNGAQIPSMRKVQFDGRYFKPPIAWVNPTNVTDALQTYSDAGVVYNINPTVALPFNSTVAPGSDPSNWIVLQGIVEGLPIGADFSASVNLTYSIGTGDLDRWLKGWFGSLDVSGIVTTSGSAFFGGTEFRATPQDAVGGVFKVNTPSLSSGFFSGLLVHGTYIGLNSTVKLRAQGVASGGGYSSSLEFETMAGAAVITCGRFSQDGNLYLDNGMLFEGNIRPSTDNIYSLGQGGLRMNELFCTNATINTSDGRDKTWITTAATLATKEATIAQAIKSNIRKFKWNDAIAEKGLDNARIHFGVESQAVKAMFEAEGLNPAEYSLFCYDEWPEMVDEEYQEEEQVTEIKIVQKEDVSIINGVPIKKLIDVEEEVNVFNLVQKQDEQGNLLFKEDGSPDDHKVPVTKTVTKTRSVESGVMLNRYGIRYGELWAFIFKYC